MVSVYQLNMFLDMGYVPRSFVTNIWIMIHTLATYIQGQCLNPWEADVDDLMHTASPTSIGEVQAFAQVLFDLYTLTVRMSHQIYRSYILMKQCK